MLKNQKDLLHLKNVFLAISKAAEDSNKVMRGFLVRYHELCEREKSSQLSGPEAESLRQARKNSENDLHQLFETVNDISHAIIASQSSMERILNSPFGEPDRFDSWELPLEQPYYLDDLYISSTIPDSPKSPPAIHVSPQKSDTPENQIELRPTAKIVKSNPTNRYSTGTSNSNSIKRKLPSKNMNSSKSTDQLPVKKPKNLAAIDLAPVLDMIPDLDSVTPASFAPAGSSLAVNPDLRPKRRRRSKGALLEEDDVGHTRTRPKTESYNVRAKPKKKPSNVPSITLPITGELADKEIVLDLSTIQAQQDSEKNRLLRASAERDEQEFPSEKRLKNKIPSKSRLSLSGIGE